MNPDQPWEQFDLGHYCFQYSLLLLKIISRGESSIIFSIYILPKNISKGESR